MPPNAPLPTNNDSNYPAPQPGVPVRGAVDDQADRQSAADLIRRKVAAIYGDEPGAAQELAAAQAVVPRSRHQQYMYDLNQSGRSLVEIQTIWHEYYNALSNEEKHQVWQEFYSANQNTTYQQQLQQAAPQPAVYAVPVPQAQLIPPLQPTFGPVQATPPKPLPPILTQPQPVVSSEPQPVAQTPYSAYTPFNPIVPAPTPQATASPQRPAINFGDPTRAVADIKKSILDKVSGSGKLKAKHHLQSLGFGLASGAAVLFIFLFGFFNEVILAPFIQPSRTASETPVIVDTASAIVSTTPKVIIPKINVEIPVDYSQTSTDAKTIETALDKGIVHYPTTVRPGEAGNAAFFGHSSNNIFNPGKYKFAFVLLHELVEGDTFYLTNDGKAYAYRVISRTVVEPTQVSVLGPVPGKTATATLITCDPPGTSLKRLVVVGEQISPDPGGNAVPVTPPVLTATEQSNLPGNGPTLWSRIWGSVF